MTTGTTVHSPRAQGPEQWEKAMSGLYADFKKYGNQALDDFDDEAVHQARVSSRKLMTLLAVLDPGDASGLHAGFKRAQKALGKVRDADVFILAFRKRRKKAKRSGDKKTAKLIKAVIRHEKAERKDYRKKLAGRLSEIMGGGLDGKWNAFIKERLPVLLEDKDVNAAIRELETAYEQQKMRCRTLFKDAGGNLEEALDELHKLRILAKRIRYTAGAASFALDRKFYAYEEIYKEIQSDLGEITDRNVWLKTMNSIGRKELSAGDETWDEFLGSIRAELKNRLQENKIIGEPSL